MHQTIQQIRNLIPTADHWTKGTSARDSKDATCHPNDPEATKFCIFGAFIKVIKPNSKSNGLPTNCPEFKAMTQVARSHGCEQVGQYNDHAETTHQDILKFLDDMELLLTHNIAPMCRDIRK